MKIISHRGNINGPGSQCEREIVENALMLGYDVEIDVRSSEIWRLHIGHDKALFELPREWVRSDISSQLWFHAKDEKCHDALMLVGHKVFMHDNESFGIVSPEGILWMHPKLNDKLPDEFTIGNTILLDVAGYPRLKKESLSILPRGICTDWPKEWYDWIKSF